MVYLNYKTAGNTDPRGLPRVYFCCHPDDFDRYFETVSNEILKKHNCAVWYTKESFLRDEEFMESLGQMQLFVMPVTTNLLCRENDALRVDFRFAVEKHIPVLPLMQEKGLEELFNRKCGELQFLDKNNSDETAIGYEEKLDKYLDSVLVGDELAEKIRNAFYGYVFLSYRKKDRRYAQALMEMIHKNEAYGDMAIWYDEFLIPGENFNQSIKDALAKSRLFVLAVTPNLVNETNYVMTTEYPMAKEGGKPIFPAELVPTDREQLFEKYKELPVPADVRDDVAFHGALSEFLHESELRERDTSAEHDYYIGLAYLAGVDVEINFDRGVKRITSAADAGVPDAMEKLIDIYRNGMGVAVDFSKVVFWQRKLYGWLKSHLEPENATEKERKRYESVCLGLANHLKKMGLGEEGKAVKKVYYDFYEDFCLNHYQEDPRSLAEAYIELSWYYYGVDSVEQGKVYGAKALDYFKACEWICDRKTTWLYVDLVRSLFHRSSGEERARLLENTAEILVYIEKQLQSSEAQTEGEHRELLSDLYREHGRILELGELYPSAQNYYEKAYAVALSGIRFDRGIGRRVMDPLFSALRSMRSLYRKEEKRDAEKACILQTIDLRLRYIEALEQEISEPLLRLRMISEQYTEIMKEYSYIEDYSRSRNYGEKHCSYLENAVGQGMTVEVAQLLEEAYDNLYRVYKRMWDLYDGPCNEEEKSIVAAIMKKRIEALTFMLEHRKREETTLLGSDKIILTLTELMEAHLCIGETDLATLYSEERLKRSLDRYHKTGFLFDGYTAYYDMARFYKKLNRYEEEAKYFIMGLAYEEKELQGNPSRKNQENLAYLYRKAGELYFKINDFQKSYAYLVKSLQVKINLHRAYHDLTSAKALYYGIWDISDRIEKRDPNTAKVLKLKMEELKKEWPDIEKRPI